MITLSHTPLPPSALDNSWTVPYEYNPEATYLLWNSLIGTPESLKIIFHARRTPGSCTG